jgi:NTP pyrophosphatase (non-canonical NTP hydrolase)
MSSTVAELMQVQHEFDSRHASHGHSWSEPIDQHNISQLMELTVALAGEVGEFANVTKKIARGDFKFEAARPQLASELADVFIYVLKLGNQLSIDLEKVFRQKLDLNKHRFHEFLSEPPR